MTPSCHQTLDRLAKNSDFANLSLESLVYEAIRCSSVSEVQIVLDMLRLELEGSGVMTNYERTQCARNWPQGASNEPSED